MIDRLEAGGMAEVFRGEALSVQGFKKQVAIKRVLPHLAQNKSFISMFLDEARLGARLSHANIVTVFDIGAADNTYFIVMEFVDGCNLKAIIEHYRQMGRRMGVKETIYIGMETCRGLSYAHELTDDDGEEIGLVHRDISPPNILLSKRGEIKVTDFGLAKATTQLEKTDPGVVKGKFSYLAPEAAKGEAVDARADIFALGIVLWEMLAGRRLFLGETDYQTVKLVQQADVPSLSRLNPEVDAELEAVLMKALTSDPHQRYESAREFGDSLAGYLFGKQLKVTSYDIANIVKQVVQRKGTAKKGVQEASIIDRLIQEELLRFTSLDDMGSEPLNVGGAPLSPDDVAGAQPLDAALFENPADWFANDADVMGAIPDASDPVTSSSEPGWRESGLENGADLASLLEDSSELAVPAAEPRRDPTPVPRRDPTPMTRASTPAPVAPVSRPSMPAIEAEAPAKSGGGAMMWVVLGVAILLLAGGAAAYFGGLIPL
ncbi:MAG: protein kinase [Sandaracinaceae bacterium]|nr:protein kinase [Sandaracinaceae bacterium]